MPERFEGRDQKRVREVLYLMCVRTRQYEKKGRGMNRWICACCCLVACEGGKREGGALPHVRAR